MVTKEEVEQFIQEADFDGYHRIPLPHGLALEGRDKTSHAKRLFDSVDLTNKTVLDVGSAYGFYSFEALDRGAKKVHGIEFNPKRLETSIGAAKIKGANATFDSTDIEKDPLTTTYDVTFLLNVIHHLLNPVSAITKLATHTNELMIVEFPDHTDPKFAKLAKINKFVLWLTRQFPLVGIGTKEYHSTYYFSKSAFKNLFEKHLKTFKKVEIKKSANKHRWIAYCYK